MQTSITRAQFRKDLAGSLWVDGVQSSCFFPLCRTVKASEKMGQRRVAKSPAVPYEPLCDFLCFYAPRKNPLPSPRESEVTRSRRKWGFLSGPLSKTRLLCLDGISAKLFQNGNNICRKKLSYDYWNISLIFLFLFISIYFREFFFTTVNVETF